MLALCFFSVFNECHHNFFMNDRFDYVLSLIAKEALSLESLQKTRKTRVQVLNLDYCQNEFALSLPQLGFLTGE